MTTWHAVGKFSEFSLAYWIEVVLFSLLKLPEEEDKSLFYHLAYNLREFGQLNM
jgi:hypothetical protein